MTNMRKQPIWLFRIKGKPRNRQLNSIKSMEINNDSNKFFKKQLQEQVWDWEKDWAAKKRYNLHRKKTEDQ